jgi:hypothetical protein
MAEPNAISGAAPTTMAEPAEPKVELLHSLGRLVRGLSALFWGLPIALVVCVQTAKSEWLRPLGITPPIAATALLFYGVMSLGHFQKQERVWNRALDRARVFALINLGLSPFVYWWSKIPSQPFFLLSLEVMALSGLLFLFSLNPLLVRLTAMLPDETLRLETRFFTTVNRCLVLATLLVLLLYFGLGRMTALPHQLIDFLILLDRFGLWLVLFLVLLPVAMTMALIWKIKEVILASVFGGEH